MDLIQPRMLLTGLALILAVGCSPPPSAVLPDDPASEPAPETSVVNGNPEPSVEDSTSFTIPTYTETEKASILALYDHLDPTRLVPTKLLTDAILYYHKNKSLIKNQNVISVIDFSKRSTIPRFFIITMSTGTTWAIHTAHGKGSDANHDGYAEKFSNVSGSNASSLGAYLGAETYSGSHGLSLRLDGKSTTNSNARSRAIVIHGADYVQESSVIQGRSWGCPAVSMGNRDKVVNTLKGGSLIFAGLSI